MTDSIDYTSSRTGSVTSGEGDRRRTPHPPWRPLPGGDAALNARLNAVHELGRCDPFTKEHATAVATSAAILGVTGRHVRRIAKRVDAEGEHGAMRRTRADAGQKRCWISRDFDRAVGDQTLLREISHAFDRHVRTLMASRAYLLGARSIADLAAPELARLARAAGCEIADDICTVPRHRIDRLSDYREVGLRRYDRKAYSDRLPRIARTWLGYEPMKIVVLDVKHLDVRLRRPDGSVGWPKLIGFLDAATGRLFTYVEMFGPERRGVRREDVADSFIAMVRAWGMPQLLIYDHGRENGYLEHLRPALSQLNDDERVLIQCKPYGPQGKPIENGFKRLDTLATRLLDGYAGPDRMVQKTQTLGKPPEPWEDGLDAFRAAIADLTEYFNTLPFRAGEKAGKSAEDIYRKKLDGGWRLQPVDPLHLEQLFSTVVDRPVRRGCVEVDGATYRHDALLGLARKAEISIPFRPGPPPLFRLPGGTWTALEPEIRFEGLDPAGAREAVRRRRLKSTAVTRAARDLEPVDALGIARNLRKTDVAEVPQSALLPPLDLGDDAREAAAAQAAAPPPKPKPTPFRREARTANLQALERAYGQDETRPQAAPAQ